MCSDRDINSVPIRVTHDALKDLISETHSVWGAASSEYQNGWTDLRYKSAFEQRKIKASNNKLLRTLKSAKAQHERAKKLLAYFESL